MAWLGVAVSLGAVVGPGMGGLLARTSWQLRTSAGRVIISSFAVPFLAAAALAVFAFAAALVWVPRSRPAHGISPAQGRPSGPGSDATREAAHLDDDPYPDPPLRTLLGLAIAAQFGLALFEATFALYANRMWSYGPSEIGIAFMVCGLVMALAQVGVTTARARRVLGELTQVAVGFGLVGASLALLPAAGVRTLVLVTVAVLALGLALISPNLAALIATRGSQRRTGSALGVQGAANSLGQVLGTLAGGALLAWRMEAPYFAAAAMLAGVSVVIGRAAAKARPAATPPSI